MKFNGFRSAVLSNLAFGIEFWWSELPFPRYRINLKMLYLRNGTSDHQNSIQTQEVHYCGIGLHVDLTSNMVCVKCTFCNHSMVFPKLY